MSQTNLKYKDVYFDSDEEVFVAMWCEELQQAGYLASWTKNTTPIALTAGLKMQYTKTKELKTKTKIEKKEFTILRPSEYTPDFVLCFTKQGVNKFLSYLWESKEKPFNKDSLFFSNKSNIAILEIKPGIFDPNNMERLFRNNQKYLWQSRKIFVNLVEPIELFKKTFLPLLATPYFKYRKSPTGKNKGKKVVGDWKMEWSPKTINEFLNS